MKTMNPLLGLTAEDLMNCDGVAISQEMPMRNAVQLLRRANAPSAPVVDELGKCVGVLSASDTLRWTREGGYCEDDGRIPSCYYQTKRLMPGRTEVVTCTLAEGSCLLQVMQPTTEGRRIAVCRDPNCFCSESQLVNDSVSTSESNRYMSTDIVTAGLQTPLVELARMMNDTHADRIFVLDDCGRPAGFVSSTDLMALLSCEGLRGAESFPV